MARAQWPLVLGRPVVTVVLSQTATGAAVQRTLLADTGAGAAQVGFELLLHVNDCLP